MDAVSTVIVTVAAGCGAVVTVVVTVVVAAGAHAPRTMSDARIDVGAKRTDFSSKID
jgi:hypothetical protein